MGLQRVPEGTQFVLQVRVCVCVCVCVCVFVCVCACVCVCVCVCWVGGRVRVLACVPSAATFARLRAAQYFSGDGNLTEGCDCLEDFDCYLVYPVVNITNGLTGYSFKLRCSFFGTMSSYPLAALRSEKFPGTTQATVGSVVQGGFIGTFGAQSLFPVSVRFVRVICVACVRVRCLCADVLVRFLSLLSFNICHVCGVCMRLQPVRRRRTTFLCVRRRYARTLVRDT